MHAAPEFVDATILSAIDAAEGVRQITLKPHRGFKPATPGSHIEIEIPIAGLTRRRSYSVVSDTGGAWTIAVRHLPDGRGGSRHMCALQAGQSVRVLPPCSHFDLSPSGPDYLLIAGGIGITPLIGMARVLAPRAKVRLLYAGRSRATLPFLDELSALLGDRLDVFTLDEGRMFDLAAAFATLHPDGEAYVCGPPPMLAAARQAWNEAGRPTALLRFETFGSGGARDPEPFRVHVRDHNITLDVPRDASLLETLAAARIDVANDCLRGECGLCTTTVIGPSDIDHRDVFLSEAQRAEGHTLCACVSRATGLLTIDTGFRPALTRTPVPRSP